MKFEKKLWLFFTDDMFLDLHDVMTYGKTSDLVASDTSPHSSLRIDYQETVTCSVHYCGRKNRKQPATFHCPSPRQWVSQALFPERPSIWKLVMEDKSVYYLSCSGHVVQIYVIECARHQSGRYSAIHQRIGTFLVIRCFKNTFLNQCVMK